MSKLYTAPASDLQAKADAFDWIAEHCDVDLEFGDGFYSRGVAKVPEKVDGPYGPHWKNEPMTLLQWVEREKGK